MYLGCMLHITAASRAVNKVKIMQAHLTGLVEHPCVAS